MACVARENYQHSKLKILNSKFLSFPNHQFINDLEKKGRTDWFSPKKL